MQAILNTLVTRKTAALMISAACFATAALADCARPVHVNDLSAQVTAEPSPESTVSLADPSLDSMFSRYADLHRDAVGYAVSGFPDTTSMVAKASAPDRTAITR